MTQTTEASCLLQSGSMYPRRLGLETETGETVFVGVKPGGVSIYFGDAPIYHFDLDGRWQRAFVEGTHFLKGLDATVRSVDREREPSGLVLRRDKLPFAEATDLDASIRSIALGLIDGLDSGRLDLLPPPPKIRTFATGEFREFLERVIGWDSSAWFAHRERYLATYGPLPFLPPDCPNALILQATLGHRGGRAFGGGQPAEHYIRSAEDFLDHVQAVARLTGRRLAQHRGVFLAGTDVLNRPVGEVFGYLEAIAGAFPIGDADVPSGGGWDDFTPNLGHVHTFLDDLGSPLPDLDGWRILRAAHLGHVTLGLESGEPEIRATFGKTWHDERLRATVADLKASEIGLGLVVLLGPGGRRMASRHVEATTGLLESLPLGAGDLVTLVDVRSLDETPDQDDEGLSGEEMAAQVAAIKARSAARPSKGPKVVAYNPLKRW